MFRGLEHQNAARMSAAGDGSTEPHICFRPFPGENANESLLAYQNGNLRVSVLFIFSGLEPHTMVSYNRENLPPPFMGEVAERSEVGGGSHFAQKMGFLEYFLRNDLDSPPPFGRPPS